MPAATYIPIASTSTTNGTTPSITFSSIPATYTDLILICNTKPASTPASFGPRMRLNGDSGNNYTRAFYYGWSSYGWQYTSTAVSAWDFASGGTTAANQFNIARVEINNYANTNIIKTAFSRGDDLTDVTVGQVMTWNSTSAINEITIYATDAGNFASGCIFSLYGIKAA